QNVRLASQLTGWQIDILTEAEESDRRQTQFRARTELFMNALSVDETLAQLLASEGFGSVEEVAYVPADDLASIDGLDADTAREVQERAQSFLDQQNQMYETRRQELGVEDALAELDGITPQMLVALGENGVKSMEDLADCATDDLTGWSEVVNGERRKHPGFLDGMQVDEAIANSLIMRARLAAGWIDSLPEDPIEDLVAGDEPVEDGTP
ncbi:MAG TPA: transcription termination/antitermination protein NusA, partial [Alphaproteobacteria bacterium]|nr:transcription termination/antitermination protein NusA [Alphaproteobacteria bacterium]